MVNGKPCQVLKVILHFQILDSVRNTISDFFFTSLWTTVLPNKGSLDGPLENDEFNFFFQKSLLYGSGAWLTEGIISNVL
jgi:hypothetical protein